MATATHTKPVTRQVERSDEYQVVGSESGLGYNPPQKAGRILWAPMFAIAVMAFPIGLGLAVYRANGIAADGDSTTVLALGQFVPAAMFTGFAAVFGAISFAIARILGAFRKGGGEIQQEVGNEVQTLKMPGTAKAFLGLMMMAMMLILIPVVIHIVLGFQILGGGELLGEVEQWSIWLEGFRRAGTALYLFAIALGLGTIIQVLRFQSIRIREVAGL